MMAGRTLQKFQQEGTPPYHTDALIRTGVRSLTSISHPAGICSGLGFGT